jgi:hypothetical protein
VKQHIHCHSRLDTCILTNDIIKSPTEHTCKTDGTAFELRKFDEQIAHRAEFSRVELSVLNFHRPEINNDLAISNRYSSFDILMYFIE